MTHVFPLCVLLALLVLAAQYESWPLPLAAILIMPMSIDGGRNKANIARSEAVLEESVAVYRQNVLVAFAEVEDNLAGLRILAQQPFVGGAGGGRRGAGAPIGRPGAKAVPGEPFELSRFARRAAQLERDRTQRRRAARQSGRHRAGADPRARRQLGKLTF